MKDKIKVIITEYFGIHFYYSEFGNKNRIRFDINPIQQYTDFDGHSGYQYLNKENEQDGVEFIEGEVFTKLTGTYCWRGIWEGRLYFQNDEYWSEDLKEISDLFSDVVEPECKNIIRGLLGEYLED